ncbi:hypothetical protein M0R72_08775 [Candidatus Pacearchaeota archaeon]|jgi:hypothetical protein|nr:hypothetical protein [Candidatus Pacearchaeota archaeon]
MAAKHFLLRAGLKMAVVVAEEEADAKATAKAAIVGDTNTDWDTAVVTELTAAAGADMEGWRLNVKVDTPLDVEVYNVTAVGEAADTLDDLADAVVVLLEAAGGAALTPSYATPNLTIAEIADNIGDHKVYVTVMPPATWPDPDIAIPGFVGAIVDEGIAGAVLTAALVPAQSIPVVTDSLVAPAVTDVRDGVDYGTGGDASEGTCAVPAAADVEAGVAVDDAVGTFAVPAVGDVEAGVEYGDTAEFTGTFAVPAVGDVEAGVEFGAAAEFTGTFAVPAVGDVEAGVEYGDTAEFTGTFAVPAVADVRDGTTFGDLEEFEGTLDVQNKVYKLVVPASVLIPRANGIDTLVISAGSAADALAMAQALSGADYDALWTNATATELVGGTDMEDWTMNVTVTSAAGEELYDVTVTGAGSDTLADMAGDMVTALEAAGGAALTPSWDAGTSTLTVAAIADGIGNATVEVSIYPPLATEIAIPGFVSTITDGGEAAAALTVLMVTDNPIPNINVQAKNKE